MGARVDNLIRLTRMTRVVVPPHVRVRKGKRQNVEGYSYTRKSTRGISERLERDRAASRERDREGMRASLKRAEKAGYGKRQKATPVKGGMLIESTPDDISRGYATTRYDYPGRFMPAKGKLDIQDQRGGGPPLNVDPERIEKVIDAVGIDMSKVKQIKVRFRDINVVGAQGTTRDLGGGNFRVVVGVAPKSKFEERHLYVVNNSLIHEMRHVRQDQMGRKVDFKASETGISAKNMSHAKAFGYSDMEVEAQMFGRLAAPPEGVLQADGSRIPKELGALKGKPKYALRGKPLWAVSFGG